MRKILAILLVVLVGCSSPRERELLETIPSTAKCVVKVNVDDVLKKAGCDKRDGTFAFTPDLESLIGRADPRALPILLAVADQEYCMDLTQVYAVQCLDEWIFTAPRKPMVELRGDVDRERLSTLGSCSTLNLEREITLLANDTQVWIGKGDSQRVAEQVDKLVMAADLESLKSKPTITDFLSAPGEAKCYYLVPEDLPNPFGEKAAAVLATLEISDRMIEVNIDFLGDSNPGHPFSDLLPVDEMHLEGMPLGTIAYAAIGLGPETLNKLEPQRRGLPFATQLAINALIALSDPEGGTLSMGVAPGGSAETIRKISLENWLVRTKLPMGDKAKDAAKLINKFAPDYLYCYAEDDALAITSYDTEHYPAEEQAVMVPADARVWVWAQVPYRSQVMKALKFNNGYQAEICATENKLRASLNILGQAQYIMPALIHDLNAN